MLAHPKRSNLVWDPVTLEATEGEWTRFYAHEAILRWFEFCDGVIWSCFSQLPYSRWDLDTWQYKTHPLTGWVYLCGEHVWVNDWWVKTLSFVLFNEYTCRLGKQKKMGTSFLGMIKTAAKQYKCTPIVIWIPLIFIF